MLDLNLRPEGKKLALKWSRGRSFQVERRPRGRKVFGEQDLKEGPMWLEKCG